MKKKIRKQITAAGLAVLLTGSLCMAGCGDSAKGKSQDQESKATQQEGDGSSSEEPVTLSLYGYGLATYTNIKGYEDQTQNMGDIYTVITDAYTKEHPNVTFDITVINPAGGNTEQLDTEIASGTIPDIYVDNQMRIAKYEGLGLLTDMRESLEPSVIEDYVDGTFSENGSIWRLPMDMTAHSICINKSYFDKIGAADLLPKEDSREWTTDEFLKALDAVKAANDGMYPTVLWAANTSGDVCNMGYLWGFGARMFHGDDQSKVALGDEKGLDAFTFMNDLVQNGYAAPGAAALCDDDMLAMWPKQEVAVTGGYGYLQTSAQEEADSPFDPYFVNFPHKDGEADPPIAVHMNSVAVFKSEDAAKQAAAIDFAQYLAGEDWAPLLCQASGSPSPRKSFADKVELGDEVAAVAGLAAKNGLVDFGATNPKFQDLRNVYTPELQAMFTGEKTPEEALNDFVKNADEVLAE